MFLRVIVTVDTSGEIISDSAAKPRYYVAVVIREMAYVATSQRYAAIVTLILAAMVQPIAPLLLPI